MEAVVLLANAAESGSNGLVNALGLGWSVTVTPTGPAAIVVLMKVPWTETNQQHRFTLKLVDADGQDVLLGQNPQTGESAPLQLEGQFEVGRPPGLPHGTALDNALTINIGPGLPLTPGATYQWRLEINGDEAANRSFFVRPQ